jgi:hypothetical protein
MGGGCQRLRRDAADAGNAAQAPPQQPAGQANEDAADGSNDIRVQIGKHQTEFLKYVLKRWQKLS